MEFIIKKKTLKRSIWLLLLVLVLVTWQVVFACSDAEPYVMIKCQILPKYLQNETVCLDDECNYFIEQEEYYQYSHVLMFNDKYLMNFNDNQMDVYEIPDFQIVNQLCSENIEAFIPTFEQYYEDWDNIHSRNRHGNGSALIIEPYSGAREAEFVIIQNDLLSCDNVLFDHVGGWLVSVESLKEYCSIVSLQSCPYWESRINPFSLVGYMFTNPGPSIYPYLFGFLIILGVLICGFIVLYRRKK